MRHADAIFRSEELYLLLSAYQSAYEFECLQRCCKFTLAGRKVRHVFTLRRAFRRRFAALEVVLQAFAAQHQRQIASLANVLVGMKVLTSENFTQTYLEELLALAGGMLSVERLGSGELHVVRVQEDDDADFAMLTQQSRLERFEGELATRTEDLACGRVPVQAWPQAVLMTPRRRSLGRQLSVCPLPGGAASAQYLTFKAEKEQLLVVNVLLAVVRGAEAVRRHLVECFEQQQEVEDRMVKADDVVKILLKRHIGAREAMVTSTRAAQAVLTHVISKGDGWLRVEHVKRKRARKSQDYLRCVDCTLSRRVALSIQSDLANLIQHQRRCSRNVQRSFVACMGDQTVAASDANVQEAPDFSESTSPFALSALSQSPSESSLPIPTL